MTNPKIPISTLWPLTQKGKTLGRPWGLMTAGIVIIGGGVSYVSAYLGYIAFEEVLPIAAVILGVGLILAGVLKQFSPMPGEMESIVTIGWGVLILAIGVIGDLNVRGYPFAILLAVFVVLLGILAVFAALRMWTRKASLTEKVKQ